MEVLTLRKGKKLRGEVSMDGSVLRDELGLGNGGVFFFFFIMMGLWVVLDETLKVVPQLSQVFDLNTDTIIDMCQLHLTGLILLCHLRSVRDLSAALKLN